VNPRTGRLPANLPLENPEIGTPGLWPDAAWGVPSVVASFGFTFRARHGSSTAECQTDFANSAAISRFVMPKAANKTIGDSERQSMFLTYGVARA
jgi:hypothetical protein